MDDGIVGIKGEGGGGLVEDRGTIMWPRPCTEVGNGEQSMQAQGGLGKLGTRD